MNLTINGVKMKIPKTVQTVTDLIDHLELSSPVIIVEHNEVILQNEIHGQVSVSEGDKIEFVQFVGGG
ncbi:sulfur carrier protein ThiS [Pseudogracilibacillus sp. SE30717A]|uniref:sulfur carrier protein ThiS n=1 Tax=Pseudogracilibacillus sp. SE30717A TaxID=3098293 RepID=UPI00300E4DBC